MRVNRHTEDASWSPNNRFALRTAQLRFDTAHLDLFVIGADGASAITVDLKKIVEPALRARLKGRRAPAASWSFWASTDERFTVDNAVARRSK